MVNIKDNLIIKIKNKDLDSLNGIMGNIIMVNGKMVKNMAMVCGQVIKMIIILVNGNRIKFKDKEYIHHIMDNNIKVHLKIS